MAVKIKYTPITKKSYETDQSGIEFEVEINGKKATGFWQAKNQYNSQGVDIDELKIGQYERIRIFDGGGSRKSYEISGSLSLADKQPKDLRFTGRTLSISNLKASFVNKIKNPTVPFTKEFKEYFGL